MALKPTIYKFEIHLSDLDQNYYDTLNLTVAQHPSESVERMMARVLAFCLNASDKLTFTKGVSATDEPDIWLHSLDGQLELWIDIGEPTFDRIKKATRVANAVKIYSINTKSAIWWDQIESQLQTFDLDVYKMQWNEIEALATLMTRTNTLSVSISDSDLFVTKDADNITVTCQQLTSKPQT